MVAQSTGLIGLSTYREVATWGAWHESADLLPAGYADAVRRSGGVPVLLPPGAEDAVAEAKAVIAGLDGLVLTGGADVDPRRYGAEPDPATDTPRTDRDDWEIALVQAALAADRPVLAVCRGLQVLNVALGGTLHQHLPDVVGNDSHRGPVGTFVNHRIRFATGCRPGRFYGEVADVATHHHQAVDQLAEGLEATAWSEDGTIEAATGAGPTWITAVQWHPEVHGGQALFDAFVRACTAPSGRT